MNKSNIRLSQQGLMVLSSFMEVPKKSLSGAQLMKKTGIGSGTLYPILIRFEAAGILNSEWENIDPTVEGRPKRRLYSITAHGQNVARDAFRDIGAISGDVRWAF